MFEADGGGGGAVKDFAAAISPFTSGGLSQQAVQQVSQETQKLVDAAKGGGFKITPEGVQPLRQALLDMRNQLQSLDRSVRLLSQSPQLGSHPYGHTVATHDQKGASEATGSAMGVLNQLKEVVRQADEALARAAGLYHENEQQAVDASKTIQV